MSAIVKIEKVENSTEFTKSKGILDKMHAVLLAQMDKSKDNLQNYATCIVMHAVEYGDVTYATKLVDDLKARKALRVDSLAKWFVTVGCMEVKTTEHTDDKGKVHKVQSFTLNKERRNILKSLVKLEGKAKVASDIKRQPWVDAKKMPNPYEGFDLAKELNKLIGRAKKAKDKHGDDAKTVIDPSIMNKLIAINAGVAGNGGPN